LSRRFCAGDELAFHADAASVGGVRIELGGGRGAAARRGPGGPGASTGRHATAADVAPSQSRHDHGPIDEVPL
jgi:hypothetical protein